MKRIDARKLPSEVQEEKRKQAIRLHKKGKRYKEIAELLEVHFETVGKWVRAYRINGMKAFSSNVRGRRSGSSGKLTPEHEDMIQGLIVDKTPDQLNGVPKEHFHLFLKECEWRFNNSDPKRQLKQLNQWVKNEIG